MNWKSLFSFGQNMSAEEARVYMKQQPSGTCQLLDVRQGKEYEQEHLPGAILIPIKELLARLQELDPQKTTLVYSRSGVRSKAACQLLRGHGFHNVYNLKGGIRGWNGLHLSGPEIKGMEFFISGEFDDAFLMAYMMEAGLKKFYLAMVEKVHHQEQKNLLKHMAGFEDGHMAKLLHQYRKVCPVAEQKEDVTAMEGGFDIEMTLDAYGSHIESMEDIIHLGMMFETQAFDLYSRLSRKEKNPQTRDFYLHMANEEKIHLNQLSRELDKILAGQIPGQKDQVD